MKSERQTLELQQPPWSLIHRIKLLLHLLCCGTEGLHVSAVKWFMLQPLMSQSLSEMMNSVTLLPFCKADTCLRREGQPYSQVLSCASQHVGPSVYCITGQPWSKCVVISTLAYSVAQRSTCSLVFIGAELFAVAIEVFVGLLARLLQCLAIWESPGEFPSQNTKARISSASCPLPWGDALNKSCLFQAGETIGFLGSAWMFVRYSKFIK